MENNISLQFMDTIETLFSSREAGAVLLPLEARQVHHTNELSGVKVLVVDDAPDILLVLSRMLRREGAQVVIASSASEAFEKLSRVRPDIIVSDIAMPDETGYDLVQKIRRMQFEEGGGTPAIALTAFGGVVEKSVSFTSGFQLHLTKPVDPQTLVNAIRSLVVPKSNLPN